MDSETPSNPESEAAVEAPPSLAAVGAVQIPEPAPQTSDAWFKPTPDRHKWFLLPLVFLSAGMVVGLLAALFPQLVSAFFLVSLALLCLSLAWAAIDRLVKAWTKMATVILAVLVWAAVALVVFFIPSDDQRLIASAHAQAQAIRGLENYYENQEDQITSGWQAQSRPYHDAEESGDAEARREAEAQDDELFRQMTNEEGALRNKESNDFRTIYLPRAVFLRRQIEVRLDNPDAPDPAGDAGFRDLMVGTFQINGVADYLDKLALELQQQDDRKH